MYTNKTQNNSWNFDLPETDNSSEPQDTRQGGVSNGLVNAAVSVLQNIGTKSSAQDQLHPGPKHEFRPDVQTLYFSNKLGLSDVGKSVLGMECYSTTLIYLLQSYGLVDANIKRWEFEEKYTPIKSGSTLSIDNVQQEGNRLKGPKSGVTIDNYATYDKKYDTKKKVIYKDGMDPFTYRYKYFDGLKNHSNPNIAAAAKDRLRGNDYNTAAWKAAKGYDSIPGVIKTAEDVDFYLSAFAEMKSKETQTPLEKFNKTIDLTDTDQKTTAILNTSEVRKYLLDSNTIYAGIYDSHQEDDRSDLFRANASESKSTRPDMTHRVLFVDYFGSLKFTMNDNSAESFELFIAEDSYYGKSLIADHKLPPATLIKSYSVKGGPETSFIYSNYWPRDFARALTPAFNTMHIFSKNAFAVSQPGD